MLINQWSNKSEKWEKTYLKFLVWEAFWVFFEERKKKWGKVWPSSPLTVVDLPLQRQSCRSSGQVMEKKLRLIRPSRYFLLNYPLHGSRVLFIGHFNLYVLVCVYPPMISNCQKSQILIVSCRSHSLAESILKWELEMTRL